MSIILGVKELKKYVLNVFQNILKDAAKNPKEAAFIVKFGMGYKMSERRRKYYKEKGEKVPKVLVSSLNSNCNFFCRGCYRRNNTKIIEEKENTLSRAEWCKILRRAKDLGVISFVFAGGEPLKRKDVLYEAAKVKSIIFPTFISLDSIGEEDLKIFHENRNIVPVLKLKDNKKKETEDFINLVKVLNQKQIYYGVMLNVNKENLKGAVSKEFVDTLAKNNCKALLFAENINEKVLDDEDRKFLEKSEKILRKSYDNILFFYINEKDKKVDKCLGFDEEVFQINCQGKMGRCIYIK